MPLKNSTSHKNRIKNATKECGASSRLLSLWVDVDYTTVSNWNSNSFQPNSDKLNQIGELLEIDNRDLLEPQGRVNTGLAIALEKELKKLNRIDKIPFEIEVKDNNGKIKLINNPDLIHALKLFAENYKKNNLK